MGLIRNRKDGDSKSSSSNYEDENYDKILVPDHSRSSSSTSSDSNEPGYASILRKNRRKDMRKISKGHSLTPNFQNYWRTKAAATGKHARDIMVKKETFNLSIASEDFDSDYGQSYYEDEGKFNQEKRLKNPTNVLPKKDKIVRSLGTFGERRPPKRNKTEDLLRLDSKMSFRKQDSILVKKESGDVSDSSSDEESPKRRQDQRGLSIFKELRDKERATFMKLNPGSETNET